MLDRREAWLAQQDVGKVLYLEWRHAVDHRLESDAAYARFEEVHTRYWNYFRHVGLPNTELSLALQRHKDGKPVDPEPIVTALEERVTKRLLRLAKQLVRAGACSESQKRRLRALVLRCSDLPKWHREFPELARLTRALAHPELHDQLVARLPDPHAVVLLKHLDHEAQQR